MSISIMRRYSGGQPLLSESSQCSQVLFGHRLTSLSRARLGCQSATIGTLNARRRLKL
jgi:hypothetical protein